MTDETEWSKEEEDDLTVVIVAFSKKTKLRFDIDKLCKEFISMSRSDRDQKFVEKRIFIFRSKIYESTEFDMELKIRMMFALRTIIDESLLKKLREVADVELNECKRIITYKERKVGGLKLSIYDNERERLTIAKRDKQMMQLIADLSDSYDQPIKTFSFFNNYRYRTGSKEPDAFLYSRYQIVKNQIFKSPEYGINKKVKMMYVSNTQIGDDVLTQLRRIAHVELFMSGKIKKYRAHDGSLKLMEKKKALQAFSEKERKDLVKFCTEKCQSVQFPLNIGKLCEEFKKLTRSDRSVSYLRSRIACLKVNELSDIDAETRIKMLFALRIKIGEDVLKEIREKADVELNAKRQIEKYKSLDGKLELANDPKKQTEKEYNDLLKFLVDNCHNVKFSNDIYNFIEDYKKSSGTIKTIRFLSNRAKTLRSKIHDSKELDMETKVQLLFGLGATIREDLLIEIRKHADVETDKLNRIEKYKSNDGTLKLPRSDSSSEDEESDAENDVQNQDSDSEDDGEDASDDNKPESGAASPNSQDKNELEEEIYDEDDISDFSPVLRKSQNEEVKGEGCFGTSVNQNPLDKTPNSVDAAETDSPNENLLPIETETIKTITEASESFQASGSQSHSIPAQDSVELVAKTSENVSHLVPTKDSFGPVALPSSHNIPKYSSSESEIITTSGMPSGNLKRKVGEDDESEEPAKRAKQEDSGDIQKTSEVQNGVPSGSSSGNQPSTTDSLKDTISSKSALNWLKLFIQSLNSKHLEEFQKMLEAEIDGLRDQPIPINNIIQPLKMTLLLSKYDSKCSSSMTTMDFLSKLKMSIFFVMSSSNFNDFLKKIDEIIAEIEGKNMMIPIQMVLPFLQSIYYFLQLSQ